MDNLVEICCGSYEDALIAKKSGANGIELNSSLFLGGITPSIGTVRLVKEKLDIDIIAMVRPRGAGFNYSDYEYELMIKEVEILLDEGVDGIAFGILKNDMTIDIDRNKKIVELIHGRKKKAVFHRAFDQVRNPFRGIEILIELGVDRVLTSGQKPSSIDGIGLLKALNEDYGDEIEILVGSGVNSDNVEKIYKETGIKNYHSSCRSWRKDNTTIGNVSYAYGRDINKYSYEVTDLELAKRFVESVKGL